jgi:hypothetical protein
LCKQLIEKKFHFENDRGILRQRDLEYLADSIEETSGIKLSLSTLKRLWKRGYDQMPHPSTLEALVSVLGYKSWQEFKLQGVPGSSRLPAQKRKNAQPRIQWMIIPVAAVIAIIFWLIAFRSGRPAKQKPISAKSKAVVKGPVTFTGNKTVSQGVPSTIIFNYDLSNVAADSFFMQQSWNDMEKVRIDPKEHYYSSIYYYPGFHKARLIADHTILKEFRVHITTDSWMPLVRYSSMDNIPVYIKKNQSATNGILHITRKDLISSHASVDKNFVLSYYNVREFENTYSDNFSLDTRIVCDSNNTMACPAFQLMIICEENIFFVGMVGKGCERNIAIKMGEVMVDGVKSDLSVFGRDLYQWQRLQIQVVNKQAKIYLGEQPVYTINFKNDFGKVVGLVYNFTGTGAIDYVKLKNGKNKLVCADEFEK